MIQTGDRVRIVADLFYVELSSRLGTVVADDDDGYWIIDLDEPGIGDDGREVPFVVEHEDNVEAIVSRRETASFTGEGE